VTGDPTPGPLPPGRTRGELVAEVTEALRRVPTGATVVVAVSGGPDSTACAFLVTEARPDLTAVLAHVRHGLRDDRHDVAAVRTQASWLGVDLEVVEVVVDPSGRGVEAEARTQRYAALRRVARSRDAGWLLVGHTADDQAETVLLRLARGTGVPGLGGMPPLRGDVLRPLLRLRRQDVHRFVELEGLPHAVDPTNRDTRLARNRVRHELLPALSRVGPDVVGALARLAELARDDARALDALAAERGEGVVRRHGPVAVVPRAFLADGDPAVTRRVVRSLVLEVRGGADPPTAGEVEAVRLLDESALDLPGVTATSAGGWTALGPGEPPAAEPCVLAVPGSTPWSGLRWRLDATTPDGQEEGQLQLGLAEAWQPPTVRIDDRVVLPGGAADLAQVVLGGLDDLATLVMRTRVPGDRVTTAGGTRKLQDVFVDAGLPRPLRDLVPVVALGERVLWVPGFAVDEEVRQAGRAVPQVHLAVARAGARRPPR
jgi:tRNA(Ile)-lysidine synthase